MSHPLGSPNYVRFTNFRRSGDAVSTPVWFAPDGDTYVFSTNESSGKVKRMRNDPRVEVTQCDMRGKVSPGAVTYTGNAMVDDDAAGIARANATLAKRYGLMWKLIGLGDGIKKLFRKPVDTCIVRVTLD